MWNTRVQSCVSHVTFNICFTWEISHAKLISHVECHVRKFHKGNFISEKSHVSISHVKRLIFVLLYVTYSQVKFDVWNFTCEFPQVKFLMVGEVTCELSYMFFYIWNFSCGYFHENFLMWNFTCDFFMQLYMSFPIYEISNAIFHMWDKTQFKCNGLFYWFEIE